MNNIKIYTATKGKKEDCVLYNSLKSYNYYYDEEVCGFKVHYEHVWSCMVW